MITGISGNICNFCTEQAYKILQESNKAAVNKVKEKAIVSLLSTEVADITANACYHQRYILITSSAKTTRFPHHYSFL